MAPNLAAAPVGKLAFRGDEGFAGEKGGVMIEFKLIPAGDRSVEYAADSFMREYHSDLSYHDPKWIEQRNRYIQFFDMLGIHLRRTANAYHKMADDALRISTPAPFIVDRAAVTENTES